MFQVSLIEIFNSVTIIHESYQFVNVKCIFSFFCRHLSSELNEFIKMIDALMTGELECYAIADLNRPLIESETQTKEKVRKLKRMMFLKWYMFLYFIQN